MDASRVQRVREEMERADARRLQPHYIESFFREAFRQLGGSARQRETRRYQVSHVPALIRNRDRVIGTSEPVLPRYERIVFEKPLVAPPGQPLAAFVCPGHPLLDAVIDLILERHRDLLKRGAVLVDERDPGTTPRWSVPSVGLCCTAVGAGAASVIEASRMAGSGALTLTGGLGEAMQESARAVLSWLRANAGRYGIDPDFHRATDIHLHVGVGPGDGTSGGVTMAAALVSVMTGRVVRGDVAMSGEVTLSGQVLAVGGISEKLLAAHRCGLASVILPRGNEREVDEEVGEQLRRGVEVHYVTRLDELLELALEPEPSSAAPVGRVS